jgi:hypothetical protein
MMCFLPTSRLADANRIIYFDAYGRWKDLTGRISRGYRYCALLDDVEGIRKALNLGKNNVLDIPMRACRPGLCLEIPRSVDS